MSIERKIVGSEVTEKDLNALNYLARYVELVEEILLSKDEVNGKYASYYLDSTVNDNYTGNCKLHYNTDLSDVTFILILEWTNSNNEKTVTENSSNNGVFDVNAPTGYNIFSNTATVKIRNGIRW